MIMTISQGLKGSHKATLVMIMIKSRLLYRLIARLAPQLMHQLRTSFCRLDVNAHSLHHTIPDTAKPIQHLISEHTLLGKQTSRVLKVNYFTRYLSSLCKAQQETLEI